MTTPNVYTGVSTHVRRTLRHGLRAAAPAAIVSGAPSTAYAFMTRADPFEATRAAGTLVLDEDADGPSLMIAGLAAIGPDSRGMP